MTKPYLTMRRAVSFAVLLAVFIITICGVAVVQQKWAPFPPLLSQGLQLRVAYYDGFMFYGAEGEYFRVFYLTLSLDPILTNPSPELFITLDEMPATRVTELSEEVIARMSARHDLRVELDKINSHYFLFSPRVYFGFRDGKVQGVTVSENDLGIKIGPSAEGPFVELPITKREMIRLFGRPQRWGWAPVGGV